MPSRGRHQSTSKECQRMIAKIEAIPGVIGVIIGLSYGGKSLGTEKSTGAIRIQRPTSGGLRKQSPKPRRACRNSLSARKPAWRRKSPRPSTGWTDQRRFVLRLALGGLFFSSDRSDLSYLSDRTDLSLSGCSTFGAFFATVELAARFTRKMESPSFMPFSASIAFIASSIFGISAKPKPLDAPVFSSFTITQEFTFPCFLNKQTISG